jgi:pantetheine-phosphate adenylyltransferase
VTERIAVYPGSFDPVTRGHLDILHRATLIFDRVVVGVLDNPLKQAMFTAAERIDLMRAAVDGDSPVQFDTFGGLTVDLARAAGATAIVRGLRAVSDFENEFQMALMNRRLAPEIHTVFLMTSFLNVYVSSSLIKEVCRLGGDIDDFVPASSAAALRRRLLHAPAATSEGTGQ